MILVPRPSGDEEDPQTGGCWMDDSMEQFWKRPRYAGRWVGQCPSRGSYDEDHGRHDTKQRSCLASFGYANKAHRRTYGEDDDKARRQETLRSWDDRRDKLHCQLQKLFPKQRGRGRIWADLGQTSWMALRMKREKRTCSSDCCCYHLDKEERTHLISPFVFSFHCAPTITYIVVHIKIKKEKQWWKTFLSLYCVAAFFLQ